MRGQWRAGWIALVGLATVAGCGGSGSGSGSTAGPTDYVMMDLGQATPATRLAINNSGDVIGTRVVGANSDYRASVWRRGIWQTIHPAGQGESSDAIDINNNGQILLNVSPDKIPFLKMKPFILANGTYKEVQPPVPSRMVFSYELSDEGTVIGIFEEDKFPMVSDRQPFLWRDGQWSTLDVHIATGLNERGQMLVGVAEPTEPVIPEPTSPPTNFPVSRPTYRWSVRNSDGTTVPLNTLAPDVDNFTPTAISEDGTIIGTQDTKEQETRRFPAILRDGKVQRLFSDETEGSLLRVNTRGDIAGLAAKSRNAPPAQTELFLQQREGQKRYLRSFFPPDVTVDSIFDINDRGEVVGTYRYADVVHTFKLTPRRLVPSGASASVTITNPANDQVVPYTFKTLSITGGMPYDNQLQATVVSVPQDIREFTCSLNLTEAIRPGQEYPVSGVAEENPTGGSFTLRVGRLIFVANSGTMIVDSLTNRHVTFRLVNIRSDKSAFVLNGTITIPREG